MTAEILYGADDLTHLEGLEAVRKRPGMYIGSTDSRGINHLFTEVVDNSTDEGVAGYATKIVVTLHADGSVQVDDDGRGIPTGTHAKSGLSGVELVLTRLHAGGKFGGSGYKTSGGLHGVGASAVNALSHRYDVTVMREGKKHEMSFAHGVPGVFDGPGPMAAFTRESGLRVTGRTKRTGTSTRYWYDARYFENGAKLDVEAVRAKLRNTAFLVPGVTYVLRDATGSAIAEETFHYPGGLADMVDFLAPANDKPVSGTLLINGTGIYHENAADENGVMRSKVERQAEVEIALRWGTGYERTVECFTNTIRNVHGGTHRRGFERAALKAVQEAIAKTRGLLKPKEDPPTLEDVLEGMTAVVHVRIPEPQFTSQTKDELSTAGITKVALGVVEKHIKAWTEDRRTKSEAKVVLQKVVDASRVRLTQKQQKDAARRKTALEGAAMPPKLVDCRTTGVARSELFLVEGDSALGCFTGDTRVALASGGSMSFADLAADWQRGVRHFGYTTDRAGRVVVAPLVEPRLTKRDAALVRVTLDDGQSVRCTPDHLFRLRDGSYRRADLLQPGDSLMPLHRSLSSKAAGDKLEGHERVWLNDRAEWVYPHHLADAHNLRHGLDDAANGSVRHHVDVDKHNDPRNLRRMTWNDHAALHASMMGEHVHAGYRAWRGAGGPEFESAMMSAQWRDQGFRQVCLAGLAERNADPAFRRRVEQGFQDWYGSLGDDERAEYADRVRQRQADYRADAGHRAEAAERVRIFFADPARRAEGRDRSPAQWPEPDLPVWRSRVTTGQCADPAEWDRQRAAVVAWHRENPEFGRRHAPQMKIRVLDADPGQPAKAQAGRAPYVASVPRAERVAQQNEGSRVAALQRLAPFLALDDTVLADACEAERLRNARTGLRFDRPLTAFDGDVGRLREAAADVDRTVASVEPLPDTADVFDLTVDGYHNFALEAGVFVHNSARMARVSEYQALLPLRGKILNVQKASLADTLRNAEIASIVQVLGAGTGRTFDLATMRYGRVILMADADVDGSHIRTLLITLFAKYMRPVIEDGRLYAAMPPLHKVVTKGRNPETHFTFTQREMEKTVARLEKAGKTIVKPVPRFKGLGEMDAEELWDTTMNPATRSVRRITMHDAEAAEAALELLMGEKVEPRRAWLVESAARVDQSAIDV
ncbi:DNA topoisomerase [Saccharothrix espanaensis DSM 44229]|uniref:DNA topoisomerase (ATP-hydrolyzing) n=1 Tax=Saccharothrix espanaensis (strain ATCC 51144 / DSM 44229 / JCM 9112 / NBRC 15066 / NRRL 15764) TaxID=1179773 RepID=K0JX47_SACES|nr:ATP-binding protein [Saccharothrix espanaensis]CCH30596.1 DNA topoisomerase [Saccharothrix espanaensis DSM 44229]